MGKIYDALKKAEQEAVIHKKADTSQTGTGQTDIQETERPANTSVEMIPLEGKKLHLKTKDDDKPYLPVKRKKVSAHQARETLVVLISLIHLFLNSSVSYVLAF